MKNVNNSRLIRLEESTKGIDRKVEDILKKIDCLCDLENGPIARHGRGIERVQTQTAVQWGFLLAVIGSIIGLFVKRG